jgi:hypothetical protein
VGVRSVSSWLRRGGPAETGVGVSQDRGLRALFDMLLHK